MRSSTKQCCGFCDVLVVFQHYITGDWRWRTHESTLHHFNTFQSALRQSTIVYWRFQELCWYCIWQHEGKSAISLPIY